MVFIVSFYLLMGCIQTLYFLKSAGNVESESTSGEAIEIVYREIFEQT